MRVVITGASGNVGTALLRVLPAEHHVVGVVRRPPVQQGVYQRASWCSVDLTEENAIAELRQVFDGADVVVHLAWGFQPTRDTRYLTRLGVGGTSAVLQAAHAASVGHLVHMSSVGTYAAGSYGVRVDESWPTTRIRSSPYSRDKSAADAILDEYEQRFGNAAIPVARMRPGFHPAACGSQRADALRTAGIRPDATVSVAAACARLIGACAFRWSTPMTLPRRYRGLSRNALRARSTLLPNRQSDETM
jgi:nucleoside-diphosphate-sugar epimerase